jgi:hypothetical protein
MDRGMSNPRNTPAETPAQSAPIDAGGQAPQDGAMDARLRKVEEDVAIIKSNYATKADLAKLRADLLAAMHEMHSDMHKMHMGITRWVMASTLAVVGTIQAALFGVSQLIRTAPPNAPHAPAQAAPSIII